MSMRDCENSRADLGEPDVRELVMQSLRDRHQEDGEQDIGVRCTVDGSLQKREEIGIYRNAWLWVQNFKKKRGSNVRVIVMQSFKYKTPRKSRAGDWGWNKRWRKSTKIRDRLRLISMRDSKSKRSDKGVPNVGELAEQRPKDRHQDDGNDTGVKMSNDGSPQKRERG